MSSLKSSRKPGDGDDWGYDVYDYKSYRSGKYFQSWTDHYGDDWMYGGVGQSTSNGETLRDIVYEYPDEIADYLDMQGYSAAELLRAIGKGWR